LIELLGQTVHTYRFVLSNLEIVIHVSHRASPLERHHEMNLILCHLLLN